jgi:DNA topoisomerase-6 subunit B
LASIAEKLAEKQKEISISEFFERNKHILGFDSLQKALLTSVKEGVDNSLDACEEAGIEPEIFVEIDRLNKNEYTVAIEDNGPGIVKKQLTQVFGRLLYGSRFHAIKQSRGQQGIGISGVVMYSQLTSGKATKIKSKVKEKDVAYQVELMIQGQVHKREAIGIRVSQEHRDCQSACEDNLQGPGRQEDDLREGYRRDAQGGRRNQASPLRPRARDAYEDGEVHKELQVRGVPAI